MSTRTAELEARAAAANAAVDAAVREQARTRVRLIEVIQQGDTAAEQAATADLDKLEAKKQIAIISADAFKGAKAYGSKIFQCGSCSHEGSYGNQKLRHGK